MERKTAFISGASRGIGEAIAITLSKEYNVIINYAHTVKREPVRFWHSVILKVITK